MNTFSPLFFHALWSHCLKAFPSALLLRSHLSQHLVVSNINWINITRAHSLQPLFPYAIRSRNVSNWICFLCVLLLQVRADGGRVIAWCGDWSPIYVWQKWTPPPLSRQPVPYKTYLVDGAHTNRNKCIFSISLVMDQRFDGLSLTVKYVYKSNDIINPNLSCLCYKNLV